MKLCGHEIDYEPGGSLLAAALGQGANQCPQDLLMRRLGRGVLLQIGGEYIFFNNNQSTRIEHLSIRNIV